MNNFIVLDTETTGLTPEIGHEIIQLSAKAIDGASLAPHYAGHKQWLLKPARPEKADPGAIKIVGQELFDEAQSKGLDKKAAYKDLILFCQSCNPTGSKYDKPIFVGWNALFDWNFVRHELFEYGLMKTSDDWPFSYWPFDAKQTFFEFFGHDSKIKNHKLDTALSVFNMARASDKHDAFEDVALTADLFVKFMKFTRLVRTKMSNLNI